MSRVPNDDLFESTTMTFGEHIEELRVALFRSLFGLVLGVLLALIIAHRIVQMIQVPLKNALEGYYLNKATEEVLAEYDDNPPPETLALIKEDGLVPTSLRLEAAGIVAGLMEADPEQFGDLEYVPHRFSSIDFRNGRYRQLCRRLIADGKASDDSPGALMWSLLSDAQKHEVNRIADSGEDTEADLKTTVALLNDLAEQPKLFDSKQFKHVDGSPRSAAERFNPLAWLNIALDRSDPHADATKETVEGLREEAAKASERERELDPDKLRRLNKLLIASVYPNALHPPRKLVVELPSWKPIDTRVQSLQAQEPFIIWLKAATVTGLVITSPWIFWHIWYFVAAGLYPHEKRYVHIYLPFSLILFFAGTALAFFFVFEPVLGFLFSFNKLMDIDPDPRISEWLSFVLFLPLGFGVAFQLPLVMLFLNRIGVFTVQAYLEKWRIAILVIFVISMLLTPADPISMLLMALPLTILYFLGIILCKWMPRGRNPFADAYEP